MTIEELEKQIHHHNRRYFIDNEPEISDEEFDELVQELGRRKPDSPFLYELVGEIGDVIHPARMLSLDKQYSYDDIKKWIQDVGDTHYIVEPKYDGMASRYEKIAGGKHLLATRGNGAQGEDISHRFDNLIVIGKLPVTPGVNVFAEVIIPLSYFNEKLAKAYKNPRNAVVGIVKSKKVKPEGIKAMREGGVHFVVYDSAKSKKYPVKDLLNQEKWQEIVEETLQMDYPMDGIVIKAVNEKIRQKLGVTQHHNKWEIAYKLPSERKWTKVVDIKDQVGRIGRLTGVAVVQPVELSGATITNITLHNPEYIKESKIGIGSRVEVTRSGEVIPYITKVQNTKKVKSYKLPSKCPVCKSKLVTSGKYLECPNKNCPARQSQAFEYFFKVLGVEELGAKSIERFINEFNIQKVTDFYNLTQDQIAKLDGFGAKSAKNIVTNIRSTLNESITPAQLLQALGIKEVGPAVSQWITTRYSLEKIPELTSDELCLIPGIGQKIAKNITSQIRDKWQIVKDLQSKGLKLKRPKTTDKLKGKSFAITGSFDNYARDKIIKKITQNGGEYKSSITKDLDYLIAGKGGGSKRDKAKQTGIKTMNLKRLLQRLK